MVLTFISLVTCDLGHFFRSLLAACWSYLEKCLLKFCACFKIVFFLLLDCKSSLFWILDIYQIYNLQIFSAVGCLHFPGSVLKYTEVLNFGEVLLISLCLDCYQAWMPLSVPRMCSEPDPQSPLLSACLVDSLRTWEVHFNKTGLKLSQK